MDTSIIKIFVLTGLFIITFLCGMLPVKFVRVALHTSDALSRQRYTRIISWMSCFAAGVFLGTCLLDLFPEVESNFSKVMQTFHVNIEFPLAEFVTCFGLFVILIVEQVALHMHERHENRRLYQPIMSNRSSTPRRGEGHAANAATGSGSGGHGHSHKAGSLNNQSACSGILQKSIPYSSAADSGDGLTESDSDTHDEDVTGETQAITDSVHVDPSSHSALRSFILLLALSLHSVFEGLAIGLQRTNEQIFQIFGALIIHKILLSFSLGINLVQSSLSFGAVIRSTFAFAISSPIGVGLGILVIELVDDKWNSLVNGILQGIACGTFLYVVFFEVLPHEFNHMEDRLLKLAFLICGFAIITFIVFWHAETTSSPASDVSCNPTTVKHFANIITTASTNVTF